jgi:hypothetical protein
MILQPKKITPEFIREKTLAKFEKVFFQDKIVRLEYEKLWNGKKKVILFLFMFCAIGFQRCRWLLRHRTK